MNKDKEEIKILEKRIVITLYVLRILCLALIIYSNVILFETDIYEAVQTSALLILAVLLLTLVLKAVRYSFEEHIDNETKE